MVSRKNQFSYDKLGIIVSSSCIAHCLVTIVALLALPAYSYYFHNEWVHLFPLLLTIPLALLAFFRGYRVHGVRLILFLGFFGILLLFASSFAESLTEGLEYVFSISGSLLLVGTHLWNMKCLRNRDALCQSHFTS
ncbi:MAG: MerC domain-containing protein [Oligoflexus sp.]